MRRPRFHPWTLADLDSCRSQGGPQIASARAGESLCSMAVSAQAQLRLLRTWQRQPQLAQRPAALRPTPLQQRPCPAAALNRQPRVPDGKPERREAPRRKGMLQLRQDKPQQTYFTRTFDECRTAARELLQEGGLEHALASIVEHPVLGRAGFIAHSALVQELKKSLWRASIPREQFQAVLKTALQQDTVLSRDVLVAGFLSYVRDDSAAAFELLQRLQSEYRLKLTSKDYTELCTACNEAADPAGVGKLISRAVAQIKDKEHVLSATSQGLRPEGFWYTSWTAAYAAIGDVEGAKATLKERASAGLPLNPYANRALALAFLRAGNFDEAKAHLDTSDVPDPPHMKGLELLVSMCGLLGEFDAMDSLLAGALRDHARVPGPVWWWAAVSHAEKGRYAELRKLLEQAAAHGFWLQNSMALILEAHARAGDLQGMVAAFHTLRPEDRWRDSYCCQILFDAFGTTGAFPDSLANLVVAMEDQNSSGMLQVLATQAYWLSVHGLFEKAKEAYDKAPKKEMLWQSCPRVTADLCSSFLMNYAMQPAGQDGTLGWSEGQLRKLVQEAEALAARGAVPQHRHQYFDLDLSTHLAWPAQLRLLAWLQGLLSTARSGSPILEYQLEARFLSKQYRVRKEFVLAPEDTRAALLGLLRNLGITAAVSPTDQRLVVVQVADLKLAIGDRLRCRGSFEAWPNRALLVKPTRA